jgi:pimeloyl-ACP methyl ester carboxylesterase
MELAPDAVPAPDPSAVPDGFMVASEPDDRIHFLDWHGTSSAGHPSVLLVHGLSQTAWIWTPVARRLSRVTPTIAMDLRGHGLSDAPTEPEAYDPLLLAGDVVAVGEGGGLLDGAGTPGRVVLAGHGFGGIVAAWGAVALGERCAGLALIDGGWEALETSTGLEVDEFLRGLDEPPEVMRSMAAFIKDRRGFDPATWDDDQRRAAEATVVETHAGKVVPSTRPHALEASVRTMFDYDPIATLAAVVAPVIAVLGDDDDVHSRANAAAVVSTARQAAGHGPMDLVEVGGPGHNLMRYRPGEVTAAILALVQPAT